MSSLSRRRSAMRAKRDESLALAQRELATHQLRNAESRAFEFRRAGGSWDWGFTLTWTPGHLALAGDLGDLTLEHYSALREFEAGVQWAERAEYSYLMEKSALLPNEINQEDTADQLIRMATEDAIYYREFELRDDRRNRAEARKYHREWEKALEEWNYTRDGPAPRAADYLPWLEVEEEYRAAVVRAHLVWADQLEEWNYSRKGKPPRLVPLLPAPEDYVFWEKMRARFVRRPEEHPYRIHATSQKWDVPDGWALWYQLFDKVYCIHGDGWLDSDPGMVLTPAGRRAVAASTRSALAEMGADAIGELCSEMSLDDYYGSYDYPTRSVAQIEAIKKGCALILDHLHPRRTWGSTWSDPII